MQVAAEVQRELRLSRLSRAHAPALQDMAREFEAEGDDRMAPVLADLAGFYASVEAFAAGEDLPVDRVQQTQLLLFRGERLLGSVRLRHRLIPVLLKDGGNIGYEIRRSERGRGYGSAILALSLLEARRIGLDRVLLTTAEDNPASIRVIEANGGVRDGEAISPNTGARMLRYWITL